MICGQSVQTASFTKKGYEFDIRNFHITIKKSVTNFFNNDLESTKNFYREIGHTIVQAILDALDDYKPEKISNLSGSDCTVSDIRKAINDYKKGILDGTRKLNIEFTFFEYAIDYHRRHDPVIKYYKRKRSSNPESSDGEKYLKSEDLLNYGFGAMAHPAGYGGKKEDTIHIRNCYKDFFIKRAIGKPTWLKKNNRINAQFWRQYAYLRRNGRPSTEIPEPNDTEWWSEASDKKISFKSCVFHEMLHLAFSNKKYSNVKTRELDEASIEDTTFKIYPRENGGANLSEYKYSFALWWYFDSKYKGSPIAERLKKFVVAKSYFTTGEGNQKRTIIRYSRGFNPPYELKYYKIKDKMDIIENPVFSDKQTDVYNQLDLNENWVADDCRDEPTKPYALPYCLCDGNMIFQDSGGGVALGNSSENNIVLAKNNHAIKPILNSIFDYLFAKYSPKLVPNGAFRNLYFSESLY